MRGPLCDVFGRIQKQTVKVLFDLCFMVHFVLEKVAKAPNLKGVAGSQLLLTLLDGSVCSYTVTNTQDSFSYGYSPVCIRRLFWGIPWFVQEDSDVNWKRRIVHVQKLGCHIQLPVVQQTSVTLCLYEIDSSSLRQDSGSETWTELLFLLSESCPRREKYLRPMYRIHFFPIC